jgi:hypothetical protein
MSTLKTLIIAKPFSVATYAPMVRLNIDFIGPIGDDSYPRGTLSTEMSDMLKTQSLMIELHKQRIAKGDIEHTSGTADYTVFEDGSYVLLDPGSYVSLQRRIPWNHGTMLRM